MKQYGFETLKVAPTPAGKLKLIDPNGFSVATLGYQKFSNDYANLLSASPELLEACVGLESMLRIIKSEYNLDFLDETTRTKLYSYASDAEAAIKKALGKS